MRTLPLRSAHPIDLSCFERELHHRGVGRIAGLDEVGRGPLAGPVVAAAVILPHDLVFPGLTDSKKLSPKKRERFFEEITRSAIAFDIARVEPGEIDWINILRASLRAMRIAVEGLAVRPEHLLIDGPYRIEHDLPQSPLIRGDSRSLSIAAASVLAKVARDRMMVAYEEQYPAFRFSVHKGYGTARHLAELRQHGPTPIHRMTFRGVMPGEGRG